MKTYRIHEDKSSIEKKNRVGQAKSRGWEAKKQKKKDLTSKFTPITLQYRIRK